jgi:hypothetical protein
MAPNSKTRLIALVGPLTGERHVVQTANHPMDIEKMLPVADVVLLVSDDGESAMVFRYTAHGEFGGDTFHASIAAAKEEIQAEYEEALLPWEAVPPDVGDAHAYAMRYAQERLNDRG